MMRGVTGPGSPWRPLPILAGGLVAGLVVNVSGIVLAHFVLGPGYMQDFLRHLPGPPSGAMAARHLGVRFGFGILCVLFLLALRPAFGRGAPAAAAVALLLSGYVPLSLALYEVGILRGWRFAVALVWSAAEVYLGVLAGGLVHRKAGG